MEIIVYIVVAIAAFTAGYYRGLRMGYFIRSEETDSSTILTVYYEQNETSLLFYNLENDFFLCQSVTIEEGLLHLTKTYPDKTIVISRKLNEPV